MYVGVVFLGGVGVTAEARGVVVFDANYHQGFGVVDASDVFLCRFYLAFLPREAVRDIDRLDGTVEGLEEVGAFDAAAVQKSLHDFHIEIPARSAVYSLESCVVRNAWFPNTEELRRNAETVFCTSGVGFLFTYL